MHPAYSVIFFTTASGAGYGLLVWLALLPLAGLVPRAPGDWAGAWGHALALPLVVGGLLSSTAHLGRPERAWRAFSQWRTSWLSREGVASVVTFVPWAAFAAAGLLADARPRWTGVAGFAAAVCAIVTVWCTAMIYRSLPTIRAWYQPLVTPVYLLLALASGGLLALLLLAVSGRQSVPFALLVAALLTASLLAKRRYWRAVDEGARPHTAGTATGLGRFGEVRALDPPHTQPNFVQREMGYAVARRHSARLRRLAVGLAFAAPLVLVLTLVTPLCAPVADVAGGVGAVNGLAVGCALLAVLSAGAGLVVERWLFFAEAQHVVTLFYGAARA